MAESRQAVFEDVADTHWAKAIIERAVEKGLITGVDTGRFEPEGAVGEDEFKNLLYGCISLPEGTLGAGGQPDAPLTRQQMAAIIYELIKYKGVMMSMQYIDLDTVFSDYGDVADGYHNAFQTVYKLGIITGTSNDKLCPAAGVTRAQAATVLLRTYSLLEDMGLV